MSVAGIGIPASRRGLSRGRGFPAFTLVEVLIVVVIIAVLAAIALPAISLVRNRVRISTARSTVATIHLALQQYAGEDTRHRYPPQIAAGDTRLARAAPGGSPSVLDLLDAYGWHMDGSENLDRSGAGPWPLLDRWNRPYGYQVDSDLRGISGPQRPHDLPAWNSAGARPWAYVWSTGQGGSSDGTDWIYVRDDA